jgi:hypothetical protein
VAFTITQAADPAALPPAAATVSPIEFGFQSPAVLHDGTVVRVTNKGFLIHMAIGLRARNLADARKIAAYLKAGKDRLAGHLAIGFMTLAGPMSHGGIQQAVLHEPKGYWVLACFMQTQDGREHTTLGMEKVIRIS